MKYRQLKTNFWEDTYILDLTVKEKIFFIYLFTNTKVNMCGIYELPDKTIRYTLDLTLDEINEIKAKFENDNKYYFHKGWVFIANFTSHNIYSSAKPVIVSFMNDFNTIPGEIRNHFFNVLKLAYEIPIKGYEQILVMVKDKDNDKDKYPRHYPSIEAIRKDERVNPEDIPL